MHQSSLPKQDLLLQVLVTTRVFEKRRSRILDMLKAEKLSFINLVDTVFTSEDPTIHIRLYADKFLTSSRASYCCPEGTG